MECESSYDATESIDHSKLDENAEPPVAEPRSTRKLDSNNENKSSKEERVRRSRASRKWSTFKPGCQEDICTNIIVENSPSKKSPFKESNQNFCSSRAEELVDISNLEHNFNEEDFLVTTPVKEDRQLLFESYFLI